MGSPLPAFSQSPSPCPPVCSPRLLSVQQLVDGGRREVGYWEPMKLQGPPYSLLILPTSPEGLGRERKRNNPILSKPGGLHGDKRLRERATGREVHPLNSSHRSLSDSHPPPPATEANPQGTEFRRVPKLSQSIHGECLPGGRWAGAPARSLEWTPLSSCPEPDFHGCCALGQVRKYHSDSTSSSGP